MSTRVVEVLSVHAWAQIVYVDAATGDGVDPAVCVAAKKRRIESGEPSQRGITGYSEIRFCALTYEERALTRSR